MTYWDEQDKESLVKMFTGKEGCEHPSRVEIIESIPNNESLLDVGCGSAATLETIYNSKKNIAYTGLDFSDSFLNICIEKFPADTFVKGDAYNLDFNDKSFDNVLVRHVLEHNRDYRQIILEALRVAKGKAYIVLFKYHEGRDNIEYYCGESPDSLPNDSIGLVGFRAMLDGIGAKYIETEMGNNKVFTLIKNG